MSQAEARSGPQTRVFLSYSRSDSSFLGRLQAALAARGYEPIYDQSERPTDDLDLKLSAQDEWWRQLQSMIAACDVMVFVVTPASAASPVCDDEIACAKNLGKRVIAILHRDTKLHAAPERLRALNVKLDFRAEDERAFTFALDALARELDENLDWRRRGAHFARLAQKWDSEGRPEAQLLRAGAVADAESWATRRPAPEPEPGALLLAFLDCSREKERKDSDARRRLIQRGFTAPARAELAAGRGDAALRRAAAGALISDDPDFSLDADAAEPHRFALWRAALRAVPGNPLAIFRVDGGRADSVAFSPDGTRILRIVLGNAAEIRIWDAATGSELRVLPNAQGALFSPDGLRLLVWYDSSALLLDARTCEEIGYLRVAGAFSFNGVHFGADGARILTLDQSQKERYRAELAHSVRLWDGETGAGVATLAGHEQEINRVAFSPDGKRVITASVDGTARLWDAATGARIAALRGHSTEPDPHLPGSVPRGWIGAIDFSQDGGRVLTASSDATACVWDASTGAEIAVLRGHEAGVVSAAFSADGKRVVTASGGYDDHGHPDYSARLWDAATGAEIAMLARASHGVEVAFSPDGGRIATFEDNFNQHAVRLFDGWTGREIATVRQSDRPINILSAFSTDGRRMLLTLSEDEDKGAAYLFDAATGAEVAPVRGHKGRISTALFSPDGGSFLTASDDATARLWDAETGASMLLLGGHEDKVRCAVFRRDGRGILTAGDDGSVRLWPAATAEIATLRGATFAFSPDGSRILTGFGPTFYSPQPGDRSARLWDAVTGDLVAELYADRMLTADTVAFSTDGTRALSASREGVVRLWDPASGAEIAVLRHGETTDQTPVTAFSPDGARLVTAVGPKVSFWDAATGAEIGSLRCGDGNVHGLAISPDARRLFTRHDYRIRAWDAASGAEIQLPHECATGGAVLSPDCARVLKVSSDNLAKIVDLSSGSLLELHAPVHALTPTIFSPDGAYILIGEAGFRTGSADFTARIWDAMTGAEIADLYGHTNRVTCAAFSPDGALILTGSADLTARLWDRATGAELAVLSPLLGEAIVEGAAFQPEISRVAFSPDGTRALTGNTDGWSRLWDIAWSRALAADRIVFLAAALDCGLGRRSPKDAADILMQDAPDDLQAGLMERMTPEQRVEVAEASRILRAPRHPNCYRAPGRRIGYWDR